MKSLFQDESGKWSSTRVFGALCVLCGIVLACFKMVKEAQVCVSSGVTLLTAGQGKSALVQIGESLSKKEPKKEKQSDGKTPLGDI